MNAIIPTDNSTCILKLYFKKLNTATTASSTALIRWSIHPATSPKAQL